MRKLIFFLFTVVSMTIAYVLGHFLIIATLVPLLEVDNKMPILGGLIGLGAVTLLLMIEVIRGSPEVRCPLCRMLERPNQITIRKEEP